jgi:hypothetical protein
VPSTAGHFLAFLDYYKLPNFQAKRHEGDSRYQSSQTKLEWCFHVFALKPDECANSKFFACQGEDLTARLPSSGLHHARCIHRSHGQALHRAGQIFANFK